MTGTNYPSDEEIELAADIIDRLPRGYLPYPLFISITSKVVTPTLELVIFNNTKNGLEIALTKRPDDDKHWPGQWHVPGTVIRSTDSELSFDSSFDRILTDELDGLISIKDQPRRTSIEFWEIERGREIDQLFYAELESSNNLPENIKFFPVEHLPANLMRHHTEVIAKTRDAYIKNSK